MRKVILFAMLLGCIACDKESSNNNTETSSNTNTNGENTLTISVEGKTYSVSGRRVDCNLFGEFTLENSCFINVEEESGNSKENILLGFSAYNEDDDFVGKYFYRHDT